MSLGTSPWSTRKLKVCFVYVWVDQSLILFPNLNPDYIVTSHTNQDPFAKKRFGLSPTFFQVSDIGRAAGEVLIPVPLAVTVVYDKDGVSPHFFYDPILWFTMIRGVAYFLAYFKSHLLLFLLFQSWFLKSRSWSGPSRCSSNDFLYQSFRSRQSNSCITSLFPVMTPKNIQIHLATTIINMNPPI